VGRKEKEKVEREERREEDEGGGVGARACGRREGGREQTRRRAEGRQGTRLAEGDARMEKTGRAKPPTMDTKRKNDDAGEKQAHRGAKRKE